MQRNLRLMPSGQNYNESFNVLDNFSNKEKKKKIKILYILIFKYEAVYIFP